MVTARLRIQRLALAGMAAAALTVAPQYVGIAPAAAESDCINGVYPLNPYVVNCNLPPRKTQVIGAAPDAGAIIACRHNPTCLSYYVNYPGILIVPGYRP
ncbi:hypothetical protein ORI20_04700 [Mycobacterium sp. CVI_P3]|uniref:Uncharacterized protein n=1 Tax=Mycobacterium pinniadriaticum TaxID=2994102 RepID=A0ABT3S907_9MYCO|nr:hypothetical protein [Mycobacterium pinniadriaticum]MCX2929561.1 hypothetical protein [Mycobacterium pinniadriaticum]MCX2935985.1 hypothetical protein [Mycobacterium pinniadriaticum]